jgi:predicted transposase YdaD
VLTPFTCHGRGRLTTGVPGHTRDTPDGARVAIQRNFRPMVLAPPLRSEAAGRLARPATMSPNPHDALFKSTFSDPRHAEGVLRSALPEALSARIAWSTLETMPGSFVDSELQDRHTDLLFRVSLSGRPTLLYVLYEHQSTPHPLMPYRLVVYAVRIWEEWRKRNPETRTLPAVVPVVLFHGAGRWSTARALEDLYDLDDEARTAAGEHLLRMRFVLDDLGGESDEALRARAVTALGGLVLYCFRHARSPDELVRDLGAWSERILEVMSAPHGAAALGAVWRYILMVHPGEPEAVVQQLVGVLKEERVKQTLMTAGEILMQRGEARGEARGELHGRRALLQRQLMLRFGPLSERAILRVQAADVPTLDTWAERVLTAASLDEVLGP